MTMLEKLKEILGKVLPEVDMSQVTEDTRLIEDLGFDSLALMMLSMAVMLSKLLRICTAIPACLCGTD